MYYAILCYCDIIDFSWLLYHFLFATLTNLCPIRLEMGTKLQPIPKLCYINIFDDVHIFCCYCLHFFMLLLTFFYATVCIFLRYRIVCIYLCYYFSWLMSIFFFLATLCIFFFANVFIFICYCLHFFWLLFVFFLSSVLLVIDFYFDFFFLL